MAKDLYFQLAMPLSSTASDVSKAIERVARRHYVDDQKRPIPYEYDYDMNAIPVQNAYGQMMANISVHVREKNSDDDESQGGQYI
jgi:protein-L-isoaspartate O-methyltransferase